MNVGDKVKLNNKARRLPDKLSKFKPGDKGVVKEVTGSLYVRVEVDKKGVVRLPKKWVDHA
jgi:hypothetical protein